MNTQGVKLPSFFSATITIATTVLLLYSTSTEKSRVVTFAKPLLITQVRKTPAFLLYQHAQNSDMKSQAVVAASESFISTESLKLKIEPVVIAEMSLAQHEIGSVNDFGFQVSRQIANQNFSQNLKQTSTPENKNSDQLPQTVIQELAQVSNQPKSSPLKKWGTVRGKFEVKDGVGVVDHIVEIKRIEEGRVRELGRIDLQAGSYSIDIENPQGILIAQIKDKNGILIGEDQQRIINLQSQGNYFEGPFIRVGKPAGLASRTANSENPTLVKETSAIVASLFSKQYPLESPKDQFQNISKNSSTISVIEDKKNIYQSIVTIRQTADQLETPLFTKKWLAGALDFISDQMKIEFKSKSAPVLIGQVLLGGKLGAGVKVEVENQPGVTAIYLDQFMIPNLKLESTSENGYFMFVGLEPENYSVTAFKNNTIIGQQIFVAEPEHISFQHIVSGITSRLVLVRSFDAFTSEPQDADILIPDFADILETSAGSATYRTSNELGLSNFIVRPKQDYMPVNYIQDSRNDHVHIPLIKEKWLSDIQTQLQINDQSGTGTIIGFVPDLDYEMYLISEDYDVNQITYFDSMGAVTSAPTSGGGFILFNVPTGAQEVVVQEKKTNRIFSQVHIVKLNQTSLSHYND